MAPKHGNLNMVRRRKDHEGPAALRIYAKQTVP